MGIDRTKFKERYVAGSSANAGKLVEEYVRKTGKLDAAKSDAAEATYAAKLQAAIANKSRQKALGRVTESEMNAAMLAKGESAYRAGTAASADKMVKNVEPYLATLDNLKLPARTADPMQNIDNRVKGVARALLETKKRIG